MTTEVLALDSLEIINKEIVIANNIIDKELIINNNDGNLLLELRESIITCKSFLFSVAFINYSGLQLLLDELEVTKNKMIRGKVITSTYLNFTQPQALKRLKQFENIDLKIFVTDEKKIGFHTKAYIFEYEDFYKIYIGSSNLTQSALKSNEEWNVKIISKKNTDFSRKVLTEYERLFSDTTYVDDEFIKEYSNFIKNIKMNNFNEKILSEKFMITDIKPNSMQSKAITNLKRLRESGQKRALVIAATGTGKTYMSAFDVKSYDAKRILFIVHREDILRKAIKDYKSIIDDKSFGLFTGNQKNLSCDYIFTTVQSISRYYLEFSKDEFDYIVIDEAHHASAESYQRVINYFKPNFLLGMTATPERTQGDDIFSIFDNNIALEVRLSEALEDNLVVPFHYFGITDVSSANLDGVDINDIAKVAKCLKINERVDFIIEKMKFYGHDGIKRKAIGFCISIDHAIYMSEEFNKKGIISCILTGVDSINKRQEMIKKLQDDENELEVIFTVDLFNEGVDIPEINLVLMLRPTASSIIFIQQLGRGLRKSKAKEFLTVLDFIGNHNKVFLIAIALNGSKFYDKDSLKVSIATDFANIKGCTDIKMDRIAKERILEQIDLENFNSLKYIKEEYNEFKKTIGNKPIKHLMEYLKYEGSPNPVKYLKISSNKSKTYIGFLEKVEESFADSSFLNNLWFSKVLKDLQGRLPLKRPFEFIILKKLMLHRIVDFNSLVKDLNVYLDDYSDDTLNHALECLKGDYLDALQKKNFVKLINVDCNKISLSRELEELLKNENFKSYITDTINYGLIRYEKEYGSVNYGTPFLKLYSQYQMIDVALMSNYRKIHSSFRGSGLLANGNELFLFVDLHKDEDIKQSIKYNDKFISRDIFQWQSPNNTKQVSERGKNLINNVERNINLHLFIRKYKEIDKMVEPYIYIGKGDTVHYEGEKPITLHLQLRNKIPLDLYTEFNKRV